MAHATWPQALPSTRTLLCWADIPDIERAAGYVRSSLAYGNTMRDQDCGRQPDPLTVKETKKVELTVVMPCLNEAETVATCVRKAIGFLTASGISGEVLIADNGSTDGSQRLAEEAKKTCPVSRALVGIPITIEATLA